MTVLVILTPVTMEVDRYEGVKGDWKATHHAVINEEYRDRAQACLDTFRCDPPAVFRVEGNWTPTNANDIGD